MFTILLSAKELDSDLFTVGGETFIFSSYPDFEKFIKERIWELDNPEFLQKAEQMIIKDGKIGFVQFSS